jgi:hypothetical protein
MGEWGANLVIGLLDLCLARAAGDTKDLCSVWLEMTKVKSCAHAYRRDRFLLTSPLGIQVSRYAID